MKSFMTLWRRELASYLLSPVGYLCMVFFLAFMGIGFVLLVMALSSGLPALSIMRAVYGDSLFTWVSMMILVPVITMRLVAEERRSGTLETLLTLPISETSLILSKYAGAVTFYMLLWLPTATYPVILAEFSQDTVLDIPVLLSSMLGLLLLGMFFISLGVLASVLTRNQIVAAIMSFSLIGTFLFAGLFPYHAGIAWMQELGRYVFAIDHLREFSWGIVDTRPMVLYLSCTCFTLLCAIRLMQAQRY